jgi:myosin heavy chain 9/10/11/14
LDGAQERVRGIEGENDMTGKKYVWLRDAQKAFIKGEVVEEMAGGMLKIQCDDGSLREEHVENVDKVNPGKFDKADDMAELTHLNEPSVVHNLHQRYQADLIYTYSGLFLVTVNPYMPLPIYGRDYVNMYKGRSREDTKPHIFAMADEAFRNLVDEGANQSILVTGESGAGKTENTKKVIQYLAAVATSDTPRAKSGSRQHSNLSEQILRANPILEAFGNAQTVRNNNSSRFGKFIRIEFTRSGQIAGAFIDWYLLEKSRVVHINSHERNYHVFYQLLRGADRGMRKDFLLNHMELDDFEYTKHGNDTISGVSDLDEWNSLLEAFHIMNFSDKDQRAVLQTIAAVLHLGNISVVKESVRGDQAALAADGEDALKNACYLLGVNPGAFTKALLHPRVRAGHEWVEKVQTPEQVRLAIDALAKGIYERGFGDLVTRINHQLDRTSSGNYSDDTSFIGVLDIAGFEIFDQNSFEQLCINYTNEKLQQFFNHHMFVLEQEEYAREQIEWKFIDFGRDLQPTIDLIELPNPIGIFSCLDEDSVMPKATDKSFTEKLHSLWDRKTPKYKRSLLNQGFMLTHYAAEVEYSTEGWLEKNKDPLNDNITRLLAESSNKHVAQLFVDCAESDDFDGASRSRVKKGLFRTVAQRHKEQLSTLMNQLHSTHPHFVRCILPNHKKKPKQFSTSLVLDQLRCNGVLEGIRIARTGFPNRLPFAEFRARYEVLCQNMPKGYLEGQAACKIMLEKLNLDKSWYRVGLTKVFFRAGVLAELEEQRDALIRDIVVRFQCVARGFVQRRIAKKQQYRAEATRIIQRNFQVYLQMQANPWWRLFVRMRPLLGATRQSNEVKKREEEIKRLEEKMQLEEQSRAKVEEERRRAEGEIQRIQHTLESERALALDKEEIFRRLQDREAELTEKLQEALDDQDHLEGQMDELMAARKAAEEQADERRAQLEQAGQIIAKLEDEKNDLNDRIAELDAHLAEVEKTKSMRSEQEESLQQEIRMLQSQLSLRDRKAQDLEAKLLKNDQDLDEKLAAANKDLQGSKKQVRDLLDENRSIRQQMSDLSTTSASFEDVIRRKDSELAILKTDLKKFQDDRKRFEEEKHMLTTKHDSVQNRLRQVQAEMEAMKTQHAQLEREAADAKRALEEQTSANEQVEILEAQLHDIKGELFQTQTDLNKERQSRDDVKKIADAELENLKREFDALNDSKVTIEKEMYTQSDLTRRSVAAREAAEKERKDYQTELQTLRKKFIELQESKIEVEAAVERNVNKQANERLAVVKKDLDDRIAQVEELESERNQLSTDVQKLKRFIADSDNFKLHHDQEKQRLERELVTIKGRLTASENDNRALLNKVQQKNLDIARSNSRVSDTQRSRITQLSQDKGKADEEIKALQRQLNDAQLTITSLEKQKEKLALSLEDLTHEVDREHKTTRNAEQQSSATNLQLAEANRKLETERQLRTQAQQNTRTVQSSLDTTNKELAEAHDQLHLLQKVFDPENGRMPPSLDGAKPDLKRTIDLAQKLEASEQALRLATDRFSRAEAQLENLRSQHQEDMQENDARHQNSKRAMLEEMNASQVNARSSPSNLRRDWEARKTFSPANQERVTPTAQRHISKASNDSARSDRTVDTVTYNNRMDLAAELELVQNQLQMSEMRNRHLQAQVERTPSRNNFQDDSPSLRQVQKLERENFRLHDMLDDSAKKVSALEQSIRTGQLSLKEVQTKSHEELYDLINSQEQSRRSLLTSHNAAVAELADAKTSFDDIKHSKNAVEVELRDAKSELADLSYEREQEAANHSQLLQEFSDLQIRLDTESSKLVDVNSSLDLYKARADEYFAKLEQAEIAVLKASRAETFAKSQAKEAEETCASIMSERKQMDALVEDLQRQTQQYEEKIEDVSTDLESALQAKKRLQNELEDYRSQRAMDIEDKEASTEQTRKKYQSELANLNNELEIERENVIHARGENDRLRDELDELRGKWDDEVLNSSTWAKEKSRLEVALQSLSDSRDEAVTAHNDAQGKIVDLLGQVRNLRTNVDDIAAERDLLVKDKKGLEARLAEASDRLEDLSHSGSPSKRDTASMDREILDLKSRLAHQEDVASAAVGKMRRAEGLVQEVQKDISNARDTSVSLHKEKANLEKALKDLQLKYIDLETRGYSSGSQDVRFLHGRIQEVSTVLCLR